MIKYIFLALFTITLFFIKPLFIYFIEDYTYFLLEQKLKVTSLTLIPLKAEGFIGEKNNTISVNVTTVFPLKGLAYYSGDINAFGAYHPFNGYVNAQADITYDKRLSIDGNGSIYGSKTKVIVKKLKNSWYVFTDTTSLDIQTFLKQNREKYNLDAKLDFQLKLNIDNNSSLDFNVQSPSLGGNFNATYKDGFIYCHAKDMHISKILKMIKQKPLARGYLNLNAKVDTKNLDAKISLLSPQITISSQKINNVKLIIPEIKYRDKELSSPYKLDATISKERLTFHGDIRYKKHLKLSATTDDFNATTKFYLDDRNYKLSVKKLPLKNLLRVTNQKPYATGLLNLDATGNFTHIDFHIKSDALIKEQKTKLRADGSYDIKSKLLASNFRTSVPLKNDSLELYGKLKFKEHLTLQAYSSSFDSKSYFKLDKENIKFYIDDIDMEKLTKALDYKKTLFGHIDISANGKMDDMDFKLSSTDLQRSMSIKNINNSISLNLSGKYTPKFLILKDSLTLKYNKEQLPIKIDAKIQLEPPYNTQASILSEKDRIIIESFSYENKQIKSNFLIDIDDLYRYRAITKQTLYGKMNIEGRYTDMLNIRTNSLGGEARLRFDKNFASLKLEQIDITKVTSLLTKKQLFDDGLIDGTLNYDIDSKSGQSDLSLKQANLNGIDIDKKLSTLNDALGLNIISITSSFLSNFKQNDKSSTYIDNLQFNLSLKDKNIKLDDVAMSTKDFRIVALGDIKDDGEIDKLKVSIVDANGCAIITQGLKGNIKAPKTAKTTTTIVDIAKSVPSSILGTGKKILDFSARAVDDVATLGVQTVFQTDKKVSLTSDVTSMGTSLLGSTAKIVMPSSCSVVYDGEVKHPIN